jgi:hypothetical protein
MPARRSPTAKRHAPHIWLIVALGSTPYCLFVGASASVAAPPSTDGVRACIMGILLVLGPAFGRRTAPTTRSGDCLLTCSDARLLRCTCRSVGVSECRSSGAGAGRGVRGDAALPLCFQSCSRCPMSSLCFIRPVLSLAMHCHHCHRFSAVDPLPACDVVPSTAASET